MSSDLWCVEHAMAEKLVVATSVSDGRTACGHHSSAAPTPIAPRSEVYRCDECAAPPHRAYFIVDGHPLCIRHAADAVFPFDDMGAHHMAHTAYLRFRERGVTGAY